MPVTFGSDLVSEPQLWISTDGSSLNLYFLPLYFFNFCNGDVVDLQ